MLGSTIYLKSTGTCISHSYTLPLTPPIPFPGIPPHIYSPLRLNVVLGIECMLGSAIYLKSTGISHSHTLRDLSSDVVTNRLLLSTNCMVLTAPKCLSYSCTISLALVSHCRQKQRGTIKLKLISTNEACFHKIRDQSQILISKLWPDSISFRE